jgi:Spy/CpxP family protein refolding chaperone
MSAQLKKQVGKGVMVLFVALSLIAVGIAPASAGKHSDGYDWQTGDRGKQQHCRSVLGIWKNQKLVQELELTDDQIAQLKDSDFAARENQLELKAQLEGYRLEMEKAFSAEKPDENSVRQLAGKIAAAKGDLFVQKVESRLTVAKILNADQIEKLKGHAMRQKNKKHQGDRHYGQCQERSHGQGRKYSNSGDCMYGANN